MQDDNTQDIIRARYEQLPAEVQEAITAADLPIKLDNISKKYSLRIDQAGALQTETLLIMLGLESAGDFVENLSKNLEINADVANKLTEEINSTILGSIRGHLMEIENKQEEEETQVAKTDTLNAIENPSSISATNQSINLILEELPMIVPGQMVHPTEKKVEKIESVASIPPIPPISKAPASEPKSINLMDRFMSAPVTAKNETVQKTASQIGIPPRPSVPGSDPYREPIE